MNADKDTLNEGYRKLGVLSTSFSELEQLVQDLIAFIVNLEVVVGLHLIEENSLDKNLQLLMKINKFYKYKDDELKSLCIDIRAIKNDRNSLIHGVWQINLNAKTGEPTITVFKSKVEHNKTEQSEYWSNRTIKYYTFEQIEKLIDGTKNITKTLNDLIQPYRDR